MPSLFDTVRTSAQVVLLFAAIALRTSNRVPRGDPLRAATDKMEDPGRGRALAGAAQPRLEAV